MKRFSCRLLIQGFKFLLFNHDTIKSIAIRNNLSLSGTFNYNSSFKFYSWVKHFFLGWALLASLPYQNTTT